MGKARPRRIPVEVLEQVYHLIVILDDATSQIYHAALVDRESTASVITALWIDGPAAGKATGVPRLSHVKCLYLLVK